MAMTSREDDQVLAWIEIGRAAPENEGWVAWIALHGSEMTLYRCLTCVDGTAFVTIDLQHPHLSPLQRLHAGQCRLPSETGALGASIAGLLTEADHAARHALDREAGKSRAA